MVFISPTAHSLPHGLQLYTASPHYACWPHEEQVRVSIESCLLCLGFSSADKNVHFHVQSNRALHMLDISFR